MSITSEEFEYVRRLVRQRAAIVLEVGKESMVESRLVLLARREGVDSVGRLIERLRTQDNSRLSAQVVEAMTTNETLFFRDILPYEMMRHHLLPEFIKNHQTDRRLHIWSAGCSSGQEPYSLAMLLKEHFPVLDGWLVRILAADISSEMITRAQQGRYSQFEVNRGLPAAFLVKYFQQDGVEWTLRDDIRSKVEFAVMNLAEPWAPLPYMDIIFMRNILIYFDVPTKKDILARVRRILKPDGHLFLGAAETTLNLDDAFERVTFGKAWCYRYRA